MRCLGSIAAALLLLSTPVAAGKADVVDISVTRTDPGTFSFDVTVRHADAGFDHYANKWEIVGPGGELLGTRILAHPHDDEQPFTRSLTGVRISTDVKTVTVRAVDSVHGMGGAEMTVAVPH